MKGSLAAESREEMNSWVDTIKLKVMEYALLSKSALNVDFEAEAMRKQAEKSKAQQEVRDLF